MDLARGCAKREPCIHFAAAKHTVLNLAMTYHDSATAAAILVAAGWPCSSRCCDACMHGATCMGRHATKWRSGSSLGTAPSAMGGEYRPLVHGGDPDTHTSLEPPWNGGSDGVITPNSQNKGWKPVFLPYGWYRAKVSQSQPLYQFTHCALYECIETSASRRSSVSVTSWHVSQNRRFCWHFVLISKKKQHEPAVYI